MFSKRELEQAIAQCEQGYESFQNCQKLATLYQIYDHLYADNKPQVNTVREVTIDKYGDSEFMRAVEGKDAERVWALIDELMLTVKAIQPRLYASVIRRLEE